MLPGFFCAFVPPRGDLVIPQPVTGGKAFRSKIAHDCLDQVTFFLQNGRQSIGWGSIGPVASKALSRKEQVRYDAGWGLPFAAIFRGGP
jgi:hypothetical protein